MKSLQNYINESIISESQVKNLADLKKGNILWGVHINNFETDALKYVKLEVEEVYESIGMKEISYKLKESSLLIDWIEVPTNEDLKVKTVFGGKSLTDVIIVGIDKNTIREFIRKSDASTIEDIKNEIKGLQEKLNKANERLQKYELRLNAEITESLKY